MLQQTQPGAVMFSRKAEDWVADTIADGGVLKMPEINLEIPLSDIYADLAFPTEEVEAG